jgi:endonuclease/exonuclease/phosphatase family metal-dependent hydrolase
MKLLNLNVGIRLDNTDSVADFILEQSPDIVTLQELTRHLTTDVQDRYKSKEIIDKRLADSYQYSFFGPLWESDGFKTPHEVERDFGGHIEQGNQILSKFPIASGTNEFFHRHFEYLSDWTNWKKEDHGRALLLTHLNIDGIPLQVITLHGVWTQDKKGDARTIAECEYIVEAASRLDVATIIAGDFNVLPDTESVKILENSFRNLNKEYGIKPTRPDFRDEVEEGGGTVDYIFVNDKIHVESFEIVNTNISDHLPLVLNFNFSY